MKTIAYIFALTALFIIGMISTSVNGDGLANELGNIMSAARDHAGVKMVLLDLYIGFAMIAGWLVYRDGLNIKTILLIAGTFTLGNIVPLVYILWLLIRSRGDVWELLLGRKA